MITMEERNSFLKKKKKQLRYRDILYYCQRLFLFVSGLKYLCWNLRVFFSIWLLDFSPKVNLVHQYIFSFFFNSFFYFQVTFFCCCCFGCVIVSVRNISQSKYKYFQYTKLQWFFVIQIHLEYIIILLKRQLALSSVT